MMIQIQSEMTKLKLKINQFSSLATKLLLSSSDRQIKATGSTFYIIELQVTINTPRGVKSIDPERCIALRFPFFENRIHCCFNMNLKMYLERNIHHKLGKY